MLNIYFGAIHQLTLTTAVHSKTEQFYAEARAAGRHAGLEENAVRTIDIETVDGPRFKAVATIDTGSDNTRADAQVDTFVRGYRNDNPTVTLEHIKDGVTQYH